jgi:hypothetical protein
MSAETADSPPGAGALARLAVQGTAAGALFVFALGLTLVQCWGLFVLAALIAWPLWVDRNERLLFERRILLDQLARPGSPIRRWLWSGRLTRVLSVPLSLALGLLLLLLAARLDGLHWAVLAADCLILSLLVGPVLRALSGQVQDRRLGPVARRWPLLALNLTLLGLALFALDFFLIGISDTRALPWHSVAEDAFRREGLGAVCAPIGWALGTVAAAESLTRHAALLVIPGLPERALKVAAWGLVLLHAGALAYLFTRLQLGALALAERRAAPQSPEGTFTQAFVYTILALAIPYLYASSRIAQLDPERLAAQARQAVGRLDPCRADPSVQAALRAQLSADLDGARQSAQASADRRIDAELDGAFAALGPGVDAYLDWYFTVLGEYERLAALAAGNVVALMGEELERHLFADTGFAERLGSAAEVIQADAERQLLDAAGRLGSTAATRIAQTPCALGGVDLAALGGQALGLGPLGEPGRDGLRAGTAAGTGAAAGVLAAKLLAKKTGTALAAKVAAKKGFQGAAALAGKAAAKKGGSALLSAAGGAALCSPGGPVAALCGIAAGAAAWLAVDKAMVEIDELNLREEMRAEILKALAEQQAELAAALKTAQSLAIDARAAAIQEGMERAFVPARDGI